MNKTRGLLLTAGFVLATAFTFSCSGDDNSGGGGDPSSSSGGETQGGGDPSSSSNGGQGGVVQGTPVNYEGEDYPTVVIGSQTWFAKNLNVAGGVCYDGDPANCTKYGRLYDWETAKAICPDGWHLPSYEEWRNLSTAVGGGRTAGTKLKATNGWNENGNGTDEYGFSALPGGNGGYSGSFIGVGKEGSWWSASESENDSQYVVSLDMNYSDNRLGETEAIGSHLRSVRCIKD